MRRLLKGGCWQRVMVLSFISPSFLSTFFLSLLLAAFFEDCPKGEGQKELGQILICTCMGAAPSISLFFPFDSHTLTPPLVFVSLVSLFVTQRSYGLVRTLVHINLVGVPEYANIWAYFHYSDRAIPQGSAIQLCFSYNEPTYIYLSLELTLHLCFHLSITRTKDFDM